MTVEEVFTTIAQHMEKGLAMHRDFVKAYNFLCLKGYKKCQYYHFLEETQNYYYLCHYYMDHYHKMIDVGIVEQMKVIPSSWFKYDQFEVDNGTKRNAIRDMRKQWIDWEKSTKDLLQRMYKEMCDLNDIAGATKIEEVLCDVCEELKNAEKKWLKLETIGYDIGLIMDEQDALYNKYCDKIKNFLSKSR